MKNVTMELSIRKEGEVSIVDNLDEIREQAVVIADNYKNIVYAENQEGMLLSDRAKLNKAINLIEDERKRVKKEILKPYERFEERVRTVTEIIDQGIDNIKKQHNHFETKRKEKKELEIQEMVSSILPKEIVFDIPANWYNKTFSTKQIEKELQKLSERYEQCINFISNVEEEDRNTYIVFINKDNRNIDISKLFELQQKIKEQKESLQRMREKVDVKVEPKVDVKVEQKVEQKYSISIYAKNEFQLEDIIQFCIDNKVEYKIGE